LAEDATDDGSQRNKILFECDSCEEVLNTDTADFNEARAMMQRDGWHARKFGQDWIHGCPDCGAPS